MTTPFASSLQRERSGVRSRRKDKTDEHCTNLSYHVFTAVKSSATLIVELTGPHYCQKFPFTNITININLTECSRGFKLDFDRCVCERRLQQYFGEDIACDVDSESVLRKGPVWLRHNQEQELEISNNCPLDYCSLTSHTISLSSPDQQCANHRSGVLCGACSHNHSMALGGTKCLPCHSHYTFLWLMLVFAVAGVLLVALLLLCNMLHDSLLWQPKWPHLLRQHCLHQWRGWSPRLHPPPNTLRSLWRGSTWTWECTPASTRA